MDTVVSGGQIARRVGIRGQPLANMLMPDSLRMSLQRRIDDIAGGILRRNAEGRRIPIQEIEELSAQWVARRIQGNYWKGWKSLLRCDRNELERRLLESQHMWHRGIGKYDKYAQVGFVQLLGDRLRAQGPISILDIGCGDAQYLREVMAIFGKKVECYGVSPIRYRGTRKINFELGLAEILPSGWTDKFDIVTSFEASMYFWNHRMAFEEACRVVKPDGHIYFGTGTLKPELDWSYIERRVGQLSEFTMEEGLYEFVTDRKGAKAKLYSNFALFERYKNKILEEGTFEMHNKQFSIKLHNLLCWSPEILTVLGLSSSRAIEENAQASRASLAKDR
jgi:SAM-dependent methyltransferase